MFGGAKVTKPHQGCHFRIHFLLFILAFCCLQHTLHECDARMLTKAPDAMFRSHLAGSMHEKGRVTHADLEGFLLELSLPPRLLFSLCFFDFVLPTCRHKLILTCPLPMVSQTRLQAKLRAQHVNISQAEHQQSGLASLDREGFLVHKDRQPAPAQARHVQAGNNPGSDSQCDARTRPHPASLPQAG